MIEVQIQPSDIAFVRIGQPAQVAITAYDRSVYGVLDGAVTTISPDATLNERTGESFYTVKVRTNVNFLRDADGRQMPIGVGMTAEVDLLGEKRTILQYILSPDRPAQRDGASGAIAEPVIARSVATRQASVDWIASLRSQ